MMPVLVFSALAVAFAVAYVLRPSGPRRALVEGATLMTFLAGGLGTVTGISNSARAAAKLGGAAAIDMFLPALDESLHPIQLAIGAVGVVVLVATVGRYRTAVQQASTVTPEAGPTPPSQSPA